MTFTPTALDYLASQPLGRLATVAPGGSPQNNPLSFRYNAGLGTIDIGGHNTSASRKIRNVRAGGTVAFVVDDIRSFKPWRVRCVEIGGTAEALTGQDPPMSGFSDEIIRIHPVRVPSFGIEEQGAAELSE